MNQSNNAPRRLLPGGPELHDPSHELGFIEWGDFIAPAIGQIPKPKITRTYNCLRTLNICFKGPIDFWFEYHPDEPLPEDFHPNLPQPDEQPFFIWLEDHGLMIDLDGLYIALRLDKARQKTTGMGKLTEGIVTELINIQIDQPQTPTTLK